MSGQEDDGTIHVPSSFRNKASQDSEVTDWNRRALAFLKDYGRQHVRDVAGIASVAQLSENEPWLQEETVDLGNSEYNLL